MAIGGEYQILEHQHLIIIPLTQDGEVADYHGMALMLSETFQVPRLLHLAVVGGFVLSIGSQLPWASSQPRLDGQVPFVAQVFKELDEVDRTEWCELFKSSSNVKTARLKDGLVRVVELSRYLLIYRMTGKYRRISYSNCRSSHVLGAAILVMHSPHSSIAQNAGHPITLTLASLELP